ncbi:hypothetical protein CUJ84_Chr001690 [Rhizobium leguminosarum]|uniref:Uncharacterized protein n=1 Tax=Rhizobium leguminosarum TaxID=384 RepID=A0A2K9Z1G1_RHILE|nr:hypothetical protein CUJ84_Chr001690 [Rhizobium leguminosarum]
MMTAPTAAPIAASSNSVGPTAAPIPIPIAIPKAMAVIYPGAVAIVCVSLRPAERRRSY